VANGGALGHGSEQRRRAMRKKKKEKADERLK
jgi:hypothetical protein